MSGGLGVDIGGVIIDRVNDKTDTSFFGQRYLETTAVPGVFDALRRLVAERFGPNVFLVSKCKPGIPPNKGVLDKTVEWLAHHQFYVRTGINPDNVRFCPERYDKVGICKELGITHFIDDRLEVLGYLLGIVEYRYLFQPRPEEMRSSGRSLHGICRVNSWQEVLKELLP